MYVNSIGWMMAVAWEDLTEQGLHENRFTVSGDMLF